jgi:fatty-acyl-CoA synthase
MTLAAMLADAAVRLGDAEALAIEGQRRSFRQLDADSARIAGGFAALGVGRGDHVGILLGNCVEWVLTWFALARLGAIAVPLNTRWRDDETRWALDFSDTAVLVTGTRLRSADLLGMAERLRPLLPKLRQVVVVGTEAAPPWAVSFETLYRAEPMPDTARPGDVALVQFTSGSTARPKGAMLTQAALLNTARGFGEAIGVAAGDRFFCPRPFFHVAGSVGGILLAPAAGACLVSIASFDALECLRALREEHCTHVAGNDAMFLTIMSQPDAAPLPALRGGYAAASRAVHERIRDVLGIPYLCSSYGMSEVCSAVGMSWWSDPFEERAGNWLKPLPAMQARICRPGTSEPCPPDEPGELQLRGPNVMAGYYKAPEATAQAIGADGWLVTGDLCVMRADGRFRFMSRLKDVIRVGGENVSPAEVEGMLLQHPDIAAAQVVALPDSRLGEVVVAYVVPRPGAAPDPAALLDWGRSRIAGFKAPRHIGVLPSFDAVMTGSGKPQKTLLRDRARQEFGAG